MTPEQRLTVCLDHLREGARYALTDWGSAAGHLKVARGFVASDLDSPLGPRLSANLAVAAAFHVAAPSVAAGYMTCAAFEVQGVLDRMRRDSERAAKAEVVTEPRPPTSTTPGEVPDRSWPKVAILMKGDAFGPDGTWYFAGELVKGDFADDPDVATALDAFRKGLTPAQALDFDACRKECRGARDRAGAEATSDLFLARRKLGEEA